MTAIDRCGLAAFVAACLVCACGGSQGKAIVPQPEAPDAGPPPQPPAAGSALLVLEISAGQGSVRVDGLTAGSAATSTCSARCEIRLDEGSNATLTATAAQGFLLDAWEGPCAGADVCSLRVAGTVSAKARFKPAPVKELKYDATDLSRLAGPDSVTIAVALGEEGAVAGNVCDAPPFCQGAAWDLFLWDGSFHRIQVPAGVRASAAATAGGRIAGSIQDGAQGPSHAFVTDGTSLVTLDSLGDAAWVRAMNAAGTVVGASRSTASSDVHAVAWKAGVLVDLGAMAGGQSEALAIDEAGRIAVLSCAVAFYAQCRALVFTDAGMTDLGALPEGMRAFAMSTTGHVVGSGPGAMPWPAAVAWSDGATVQLDDEINARDWPGMGIKAGGHLASSLSAVSANGDAVGEVDIAISEGGAMSAFLWKGGKLIDLETITEPTTRLFHAFAINSRGQILAHRGPVGYAGQSLLTPR